MPTPPCAAVLVFWTVKIQGSYLYFWLNYLCTIVNGIGEEQTALWQQRSSCWCCVWVKHVALVLR